jgi:hypothetical protein
MRTTPILLGAAVAAATGMASAGDHITSYYLSAEGSLADPQLFAITPFFAVTDPGQPDPVGYLSGPAMTVTDFLNGQAYVLTGDMAGAAAELTNGVDSLVYFGGLFPNATSTQAAVFESAAFAAYPGLVGPDLTGFVVTEVRIFGVSLLVTDNSFDATIEFQFHGRRVPATGSLGVLAAAGVLGVRRRRGPARR